MKGSSEQVEEPFAGELHRGEQKLAGHEMENLLRNTDSTSITTMFPDSGPTCVSLQGTSRTLDHWVGLVGIHHIVEESRVLWQTVRRLQLIPDGLPRDHLPILLILRYILQLQRGETRRQPRARDQMGPASDRRLPAETYGHMGDNSEQHLHARNRLISLKWQLGRWNGQFAAARRASLESAEAGEDASRYTD